MFQIYILNNSLKNHCRLGFRKQYNKKRIQNHYVSKPTFKKVKLSRKINKNRVSLAPVAEPGAEAIQSWPYWVSILSCFRGGLDKPLWLAAVLARGSLGTVQWLEMSVGKSAAEIGIMETAVLVLAMLGTWCCC